VVFLDLFGALEKIAEILRNMANDGEFVGMLNHLLANAQGMTPTSSISFSSFKKSIYT